MEWTNYDQERKKIDKETNMYLLIIFVWSIVVNIVIMSALFI